MSKNSMGSFLDAQFVDFEVQAEDRRLGEFQCIIGGFRQRDDQSMGILGFNRFEWIGPNSDLNVTRPED